MSSNLNLTKKPIIEVVALALRRSSDGRFLVTRRGPGQSGAGEWEFPGGKIEDSETQTTALQREIQEELGFIIDLKKLVYIAENEHAYPLKTVLIYLWGLKVDVVPDIQLTEHDQLRWCNPDEMIELRLSAGDQAFIEVLRKVNV